MSRAPFLLRFCFSNILSDLLSGLFSCSPSLGLSSARCPDDSSCRYLPQRACPRRSAVTALSAATNSKPGGGQQTCCQSRQAPRLRNTSTKFKREIPAFILGSGDLSPCVVEYAQRDSVVAPEVWSRLPAPPVQLRSVGVDCRYAQPVGSFSLLLLMFPYAAGVPVQRTTAAIRPQGSAFTAR